MRAGALSDKKVGQYVAAHYVAAWRKVGTFQVIQQDGKTVARNGGNIAVYFCTPDLEVINAIAGPTDKDAFLREAQWAADVYASAPKDDREKLSKAIAAAHAKEREKRCADLSRVAMWSYSGVQVQAKAATAVLTGRLGRRAKAARVTTCEVQTVTADAVMTDAWQTQVVNGVTTTNLAYNVVDANIVATEAVLALALVAGGTDMHQYLSDKGLPKLESICKDVFQSVLGEVVSDKPVNVTSMEELCERRISRVHLRELRERGDR